MSMYKAEYAPPAIKQLKKMGKHISALIIGWIEKNLVGCENPRQYGKGLVANRSGEWQYRIGDYRILADIQDDKLVILIITVGHRREVYDS